MVLMTYLSKRHVAITGLLQYYSFLTLIEISRTNIINAPFPAQHPQSSHTPKFAVFPGQDSPDDTRNGRLALRRSTSLPSFAPSGCDNYVVAEKISGSPHRREVVRVLSDSERQPLQWHGHSFDQVSTVKLIITLQAKDFYEVIVDEGEGR